MLHIILYTKNKLYKIKKLETDKCYRVRPLFSPHLATATNQGVTCCFREYINVNLASQRARLELARWLKPLNQALDYKSGHGGLKRRDDKARKVTRRRFIL